MMEAFDVWVHRATRVRLTGKLEEGAAVLGEDESAEACASAASDGSGVCKRLRARHRKFCTAQTLPSGKVWNPQATFV